VSAGEAAGEESTGEKTRPELAWVVLGLLAALVATNGVFLVLSRTSGPLIGLVFYCAVVWRWYRRDYRAGIVGGLVGLGAHAVEVVVVGWTDFPLLLALNLIFPALLASVSWLTIRQVE
jgi:hypothetical protein